MWSICLMIWTSSCIVVVCCCTVRMLSLLVVIFHAEIGYLKSSRKARLRLHNYGAMRNRMELIGHNWVVLIIEDSCFQYVIASSSFLAIRCNLENQRSAAPRNEEKTCHKCVSENLPRKHGVQLTYRYRCLLRDIAWQCILKWQSYNHSKEYVGKKRIAA